MANPLRLREMQERNGIKPKKSKEEKKREKDERKRLKHERKHLRDKDSRSPDSRRRIDHKRTPSRDAHDHRPRSLSPYDHDHRRRSPSPYGRSRTPPRPRYSAEKSSRHDSRAPRRLKRSPSPEYHRDRSRSSLRGSRVKVEERPAVWPRSDESDDNGRPMVTNNSRPADHGKRPRSRSPRYDRRDRSPLPKRVRSRSPPRPRPDRPAEGPSRPSVSDDRAARLAAMTSNASAMSAERQERLAAMLEKEKAELAADEEARAKSKGTGGFLSHEQKKVFGGSGGLEERIRRGRGGMIGNLD